MHSEPYSLLTTFTAATMNKVSNLTWITALAHTNSGVVISLNRAIRGPLHCCFVGLTVLPSTSLLPSDLYSNATFSVDFLLYTLHKITILVLQHSLPYLCIILSNTYHVVPIYLIYFLSLLYININSMRSRILWRIFLRIFIYLFLILFILFLTVLGFFFCTDFFLTALPVALFYWLKYLLTWI